MIFPLTVFNRAVILLIILLSLILLSVTLLFSKYKLTIFFPKVTAERKENLICKYCKSPLIIAEEKMKNIAANTAANSVVINLNSMIALANAKINNDDVSNKATKNVTAINIPNDSRHLSPIIFVNFKKLEIILFGVLKIPINKFFNSNLNICIRLVFN